MVDIRWSGRRTSTPAVLVTAKRPEPSRVAVTLIVSPGDNGVSRLLKGSLKLCLKLREEEKGRRKEKKRQREREKDRSEDPERSLPEKRI